MMNPAGNPPLLEVRELDIAFRTGKEWTRVVRNLSFSIHQNETLALVGESGSGKSVAALSIMRLLPAEHARVSGRIEVKGQNLLELSDAAMRRVRGGQIGMVFQEPMTSLNPVYTVGYQLRETLRLHRPASGESLDAEARRLLDLVRIPDAARRMRQYPHEISGGMRQRVMIAIALAGNPSLLIADEPTTALDVTVQAQILDLIGSIQDELGTAVLFITHDMGVVAQIADRVLVMQRGVFIECQPTPMLFSAPSHDYTSMLLKAVPVLGSMKNEPGPRKFSDGLSSPEGTESRVEPVPPASPVLSVTDLSLRFPIYKGLLKRHVGNVHAVERVSFQIAAGETLSLVGESGCGKTTVGRAVMHLIPYAEGAVRFDGQDLGTMSPRNRMRLRRRMQMIFQDPFGSLNPRYTVGHALSEVMRAHEIATTRSEMDDRVAEALRQVRLDPAMAQRYPHQFSGGQRQRICIARALVLEPALLVADEVVSALDASVKAQIIDLLIELQQHRGISCLFISHDMAVVERISHRVAVMYLGQIVEIGPRVAVLGNPQHPYTQRLLAAVPIPDPQRRNRARQPLEVDELPSPIRPLGSDVPVLPYVEVGAGHYVQAFGE